MPRRLTPSGRRLLRRCPRPAALAAVSMLAACGGAAATPGGAAARAPAPGSAAASGAVIRINLVGYPSDARKRAVLLARHPAGGERATVLDAAGARVATIALGRRGPAWSAAWPYAYPLDLTALRTPGTYTARVTGTVSAVSPPIHVASAAELYAPLVANAVRYLRAKRDGPDVDPTILGRRPSHLDDARADEYAAPVYRGGRLVGGLHRVGGPIDVAGGWMDAGDTLKFAETSSFTEVALLLALRDTPSGLGASAGQVRDEAAFGLDWLLKLWDPATRRLVYQVGLGTGNNGSILGAHETRWRLPQADDALHAKPGSPEYYDRYRPAFVTGPAISPNLAGRMAAAYALAAQVLGPGEPALGARALHAAETIYAAARTSGVGRLTTAVPYGFYPELEWRDDMELGAAELALATRGTPAAAGYLRQAGRWAAAYATSPLNGTDSLNLYDVSSLAHADTTAAMRQAGASQIAVKKGAIITPGLMRDDLLGQERLGAAQARRDPFGYLGAYRDDDVVAHALGWSLEAPAIDALSADTALATTGAAQRDLVLGANPWGTSFVVGAGGVFPHCLHDPVANLSGSLTGGSPLMLGATVAGPSSAADLSADTSTPTGARRGPVTGGNPFRTFDGRGAVYVDSVGVSANIEPSIDLGALSLLSFARAAQGG